MHALTICSLNTNGLNDMTKRRDVFNYLRNKNFSIICLQETHFNENMEKLVKSEWGYKCFFDSYATISKGVAILFLNNFQHDVHKIKTGGNGAYIVLDLTIESKRFTLVNLYAPNRDTPLFFENIKREIESLPNTECIAVGVWNLELDPDLDCLNYKHVNNPRARRQVLSLKGDINLVDVWRENNPEDRKFTWRKKIRP